MGGEQCLTRGGLVVLLKLELLEKKVGTCAHERVGLGSEHKFDMAEFGIQATEKVQDLARLGDGMTDIAQVVGELLQLGAVLVDAEVTLDDIAEFRLEQDSALKLIVSEETFDFCPDGEGGSFKFVDEVEDTLVDGGVDPICETAIHLLPLGVAIDDGRRRADMAGETKLAKN
jgi:hypothetical protein